MKNELKNFSPIRRPLNYQSLIGFNHEGDSPFVKKGRDNMNTIEQLIARTHHQEISTLEPLEKIDMLICKKRLINILKIFF